MDTNIDFALKSLFFKENLRYKYQFLKTILST